MNLVNVSEVCELLEHWNQCRHAGVSQEIVADSNLAGIKICFYANTFTEIWEMITTIINIWKSFNRVLPKKTDFNPPPNHTFITKKD